MNKNIFYIVAFVVALFIPFTASAAEFRSAEQSFVLDEGETINDDVFIGAQRVQIDGDVNGDVFIGANSVEINGNISGSVFVGANTIRIAGNVGNDIYAGGNDIVLSGNAEENVYAAASTVFTQKDFAAGRDLFVGAGSAEIMGSIGKNLAAGTGDIAIDGDIAGSAYVSSGDEKKSNSSASISIEENARIADNFEYRSNKPAEISESAVIGGVTDYEEVSSNSSSSNSQPVSMFGFSGNRVIFKVISWVSSFFWLTVVGLFLVFIFKDRMKDIQKKSEESHGKTLGTGLLVAIIVPIVIIFFAVTLVGLPIAFALAVLYAIVMYAAKAFASYLVGKQILPKQSPYAFSIVGALIISLAITLPFIGWLIDAFVVIFGLGAFALYYKDSRKRSNNATSRQKKAETSSKKTKKSDKKDK